MVILELRDEKSLLIHMVVMHLMVEEHLVEKTAPKSTEVAHTWQDI